MQLGKATTFAAILCACASACDMPSARSPLRPDAEVPSESFTAANRSSAPIVSSRWSTEEARDKAREADTVMEIAGTTSGMTVADIGAGEGYYTVRLAEKVGNTGRVLAQDIIPAVKAKLASRIDQERWDNVSVTLGTEADPKLPENSFDRVFMVHMYHEITRPYEFLWRLRPSLRMGGRIIVVDGNRTVAQHGTPPALLDCEMRAVGFHRVDLQQLPSMNIYLAAYEVSGLRPSPDKIRACP